MTVQTPKTKETSQAKTEAPLAIDFDAAEFMHFLEGTDWTDEEKSEYLALIWNIVCDFVAMGFDVHPVQQAKKTCGQVSEAADIPTPAPEDEVHSKGNPILQEFGNALDKKREKEGVET